MSQELTLEETFENLLTDNAIPPEDPRRSFGVCRGCDPPTKGFYDPPAPLNSMGLDPVVWTCSGLGQTSPLLKSCLWSP